MCSSDLGHFFEHHVPRGGRRVLERLGIIHQHVWAPEVGHTVMHAVNRVPGRIFQAVVDLVLRWDQIGVDRLHTLARDQAQRRVTRGCDQIKAALVHQGNHFV